jgi:hypothetical protein
MASLEFLKGATRGLQEEWMEGNLKGDYLMLMPGLCLEDRMSWCASSRWRRVILLVITIILIHVYSFVFLFITNRLCSLQKLHTEIKLKIAMAKEIFNTKISLLINKLNIEPTKKLVICYVSSIALYGSETWT